MSNTFISPNPRRTKDFLDKNGNIIKREVAGQPVATPALVVEE